MIELFKSLRRGNASDPLEVLAAMTARLPTEARGPTLELLELVREAPSYGPPDPPEWLRVLLGNVSSETGLSPWLLAAVSWHVASYSPSPRPELGPHGVLGVPLGLVSDPERFGAAPEELEGEGADLEALGEAVERVKRGAWTGGRILARYRELEGSLPAGLERYLLEALGPSVAGQGDPTSAGPGRSSSASDVVGTFAVLLARRAPGASELDLDRLEAGG